MELWKKDKIISLDFGVVIAHISVVRFLSTAHNSIPTFKTY
jgi:hypothetical protein